MSLKFNASSMLNGMSKWGSKADMAIQMYGQTSATKMENYAKQNRKWKDRTGDARKRLTCKCYSITNGYRLELAHGVDYGMWLELSNNKRYAIISETIYLEGSEIMKGFNRLLDKLGGI